MITDFRLKVFQTVALQLSFTAAARILYISQPAVTRHINELEKNIQKPLFHRHGSSISLTKEGELLMAYTRKIMALYEDFDTEIKALQNNLSGQLRIGASTTVAQYVLPAILARFKKVHPQAHLHLQNANTREIEQRVSDQIIDIGIIEGQALNPLLHYEPFIKDEIVLVTHAGNKSVQDEVINKDELKRLPLVLRERGSGTLDVVLSALKKRSISERDLQVVIELGSTESVKNYLMYSDAFAFLSVHTIIPELSTGQLQVIEIAETEINRTFQFVSLHGQHNTVLSRFKQFCLSHYKQNE